MATVANMTLEELKKLTDESVARQLDTLLNLSEWADHDESDKPPLQKFAILSSATGGLRHPALRPLLNS